MMIRRTAVAVTSVAALSLAGAGLASPANAAPGNRANQTGLVNLAVQDTAVQVPIALAANICGVGVNVLATATALTGVDCTADGVSVAQNDGSDTNRARQNGLVNVALQDTTVQVPVAVAANICGVAVNALSGLTIVGDVTCESLADAAANNG